MNSGEIDKALVGVKGWKGCFSKDELALQGKHKAGFYVVNLGDSDTGGTHWTCCANFDGSERSLYFDSFGVVPPLETMAFMWPRYKYNKEQVQGEWSESCGLFCIYVIKQWAAGRSMRAIGKDFSDNYRKNEKIIAL